MENDIKSLTKESKKDENAIDLNVSNKIVKSHDFEKAKNELKKFSKNIPSKIKLTKVNADKDVGEWALDFVLGAGVTLDHKVTGRELNKVTNQIQESLIKINNTQIKSVKEFNEIYNALEALDKDYIQAILLSIDSVNETSKSLSLTNDELKRSIEKQKYTLQILHDFKHKMDNINHLSNIDELWDKTLNVEANQTVLEDKINDINFDEKFYKQEINSLNTKVHDLNKKYINFKIGFIIILLMLILQFILNILGVI